MVSILVESLYAIAAHYVIQGGTSKGDPEGAIDTMIAMSLMTVGVATLIAAANRPSLGGSTKSDIVAFYAGYAAMLSATMMILNWEVECVTGSTS